MVYVDYRGFAKQLLDVTHIEICPQNCSLDLTAQRCDPRAVIVVDNPSGTLVLLRLTTTQHKEVWVATNRTTQINVTFDGGLYVDVYPLYPLSDAGPRSAYLPGNGNLTIRVTPPAIGGILQPFQAIIGAMVGLLTTLGIVKHLTKTPAVNAMGNTFPKYKGILFYPSVGAFSFLIFLSLISGLIDPYILLLTFLFSFFIIIISVRRQQFSKNNIILLLILIVLTGLYSYYTFMSILPHARQLYFTALFLTLINPISLFYLKSLAAVSGIRRAEKVGLLHLYDLAVLIWFLQWLINPYPTIFKLEFIVLSHFLIYLVIISIILGIIIFFALSINLKIFLYSSIPFVFNEELAARIAFCRKALARNLWITIYPQKGCRRRGRVDDCDVDRIVLRRGRFRREFSWSEIRWIRR